jgi:hypothetical protein
MTPLKVANFQPLHPLRSGEGIFGVMRRLDSICNVWRMILILVIS